MTKEKKPIRLETLEEIKVFSDPYRMLIFKTFDRMGKPSTIKQVADKMGEVPAKVYYHAKKLISIGVLELDHEENINGIIAKYYLPTTRQIIVSHDSIDEQHLPTMMSETEKMLSRIMEEARGEFLRAVKHKLDNKEDGASVESKASEGGLFYTHLYLSEDEAEQVTQFVDQLIESRKVNDKEKERKRYMFLNGLVQSDQ